MYLISYMCTPSSKRKSCAVSTSGDGTPDLGLHQHSIHDLEDSIAGDSFTDHSTTEHSHSVYAYEEDVLGTSSCPEIISEEQTLSSTDDGFSRNQEQLVNCVLQAPNSTSHSIPWCSKEPRKLGHCL